MPFAASSIPNCLNPTVQSLCFVKHTAETKSKYGSVRVGRRDKHEINYDRGSSEMGATTVATTPCDENAELRVSR